MFPIITGLREMKYGKSLEPIIINGSQAFSLLQLKDRIIQCKCEDWNMLLAEKYSNDIHRVLKEFVNKCRIIIGDLFILESMKSYQ